MQNATEAQPALRYSQGRFRAVLTFRAPAESKRGAALIGVATLLRECELVLAEAVEGGVRRKRKPLNILVAVSVELLRAAPEPTAAHRAMLGEIVATQPEQPDVIVQIAAETEDERTYALRLVKRTLGGFAELDDQFYGGRHTIGREPFGYQDAGNYESEKSGALVVPNVPLAVAGEGATWLIYQDCRQHMEEFFALPDDDQDAIMGRRRDPDPDAPFAGRPDSHAVHAKASGEGLVRRSMSYERYTEAGVVFLAAACSPVRLERALSQFRDGDRLAAHVQLRNGGLFVVPPTSQWLVGERELPVRGMDIPSMEVKFYPRTPLVLYEMTPATLEFFLRVFHDNKDNFDDAGVLRQDLQLVGKGLAKLLFGARIDPESLVFKLLERIFEADTCDRALAVPRDDSLRSPVQQQSRPMPPISDELRDAMLRASRDRKAHESEKSKLAKRERGHVNARELSALRAKFRDRSARDRNVIRLELANTDVARKAIDGSGLESTSAVELYAEMIEIDAVSIHGLDAQRKRELSHIIELCKEAANEARELNESVGKYMTFVC